MPGYVIDGNIGNYSGKVVLLSPGKTDQLDTLEQAEVRDGKFRLQGKVEGCVFAWLKIEQTKTRIPIFLENTSFVVRVNLEEQPVTWDVAGGRAQQVRTLFKENVEQMIKEKRDSLEGEYEKYVKENNLFGKMHIRALARDLDSLYEREEDKFIRKNDNIVSASLIYARLSRLIKEKKLAAKYELLGDSARSSSLGKLLSEYVEKEVDTRIGATVPDFTLHTPEGKPVSLYSVQAKVKIIDFWASWCGPCRAENPHVKKLYEKYQPAGLEIIGISLDSKKDKWINAIRQDNLPWIHLSDLKAWESPLVKMFGIQGIPFVLVLDKDNRILGTGLHGEKLDRCVAEAIR